MSAPTVTTIVHAAFDRALRAADTPAGVRAGLPEALRRELRAAGLAIHSEERCARIPPATEEGRELSPEEHAAAHPTPRRGCVLCGGTDQ